MPAPLIPHNWRLPDYFRGRLGTSVGRQRAMHLEGQLLLVIHHLPLGDNRSRRGQLFWRDEQAKWLSSDGLPGNASIEKLIHQYQQALEDFDKRSNQVGSAQHYLELLENLGPIVRTARGFYETLQQAREFLPDAKEIIDWRDKMEEITLEFDQLYADLKTAMDVALIRHSEQHAEISRRVEQSAHRLNVLAALFFPLATLGSVLGTTLTEGWNWSRSGLPFALFLLFGAFCGVLLAGFVTRPKAATGADAKRKL